MKIIVDFDNAFGVKERDVDDFIALLYLIRVQADIVLVTTTFGNASIEEVDQATKMVFHDLDLDMDLGLGNEDAAEKIVEKVNGYPGNITILSLGSTTNIARALELDRSIRDKARILSMGTITEKLYINGKVMDELNYSVDHEASSQVLDNFTDISILTANNCLEAYLTLDELREIFSTEDYLMDKAVDWFDFHSKDYDIDYIVVWDLIAAVYFTDPDLFENDIRKMAFTEPEKGLLEEGPQGRPVNMPKVKDRDDFVKRVSLAFKG